MSYCNMCGKCCEAICLFYSLDELKTKPQSGDVLFVLENWSSVSQEEALLINPHLYNWIGKRDKAFFYACKNYNKETHLCNIHLERPRICRDYPFYGREKLPFNEQFYSEECGYDREDLKNIQK